MMDYLEQAKGLMHPENYPKEILRLTHEEFAELHEIIARHGMILSYEDDRNLTKDICSRFGTIPFTSYKVVVI